MQKLRGSGSTFSTSGKRWNPFRINRKVAARNAKHHRLLSAGLITRPSKDEARRQAEQAAASHPIKRIGIGKRSQPQRQDD